MAAKWLLTTLALAGLGEMPRMQGQTSPPSNAPRALGTVRRIELPHLEPELAVAPGLDDFQRVCTSCHSPRYVLMQPTFAQRQWEATVDKMANTYGATFDAEQRTAIVSYLVAIRGPGASLLAPVPADDDVPAPAANQSPAPPEIIPPLPRPKEATARTSTEKRGADLYAANCAGCHGSNGRGDGWVAPMLLRAPKDLAATRFSMALLSQVLWNGKRGTAMPSWRGFSADDRAALGLYVQSLHAPLKAEEPTQRSIQRGSELFIQNCAPCHGEAGDGQGVNAANLLPRPANFKLKQPNPHYLLQVLHDGIPGTAMPSWKDLISDDDRKALADYVRSIFVQDDGPTP